MPRPLTSAFRSLRSYNYRVWAAGALVSNIGTWIQRIAQDWLVLTQLTHHNATAVGVVMALQFAPMLLLLPASGFAADHFDRRKLLLATQAALGVLALALGLLTVSGMVRLWHVYGLALLFGCVTAIDTPARQTFVSDLVDEADLTNAVALNSTSFNGARMVGPAIAGLLIAAVGSGYAFLLNALSFAAVLASLALLRVGDLRRHDRSSVTRGGFADGLRYVWTRPDLKTAMLMSLLIGTFGLNFPIFISTMSLTVFHAGAGRYGVLMSLMSVGTIAGALMAAGRERPGMAHLLGGAAFFGGGLAVAALMPDYWSFGTALVFVGVAGLTFTNSTNALVQLATEPAMRGRVMALRLATQMGGTPLGAPLVGWVADRFGPRWALGVGAASGIVAALVALRHVAGRYSARAYPGDPARLRRVPDEVDVLPVAERLGP